MLLRFLFFCVLSFGYVSSAHAVTVRPVCSSCTYTTMAAALAASAATDIVELRGDITENVVLNQNVAQIRADVDRTRRWSSTGSAATLEIQSGVTQSVLIQGIGFDHDAGSGYTIYCAGTGAAGKLRFFNCDFSVTGSTA